MGQISIKYASEDQAFVHRLAEALERHNGRDPRIFGVGGLLLVLAVYLTHASRASS